MTVIIDIGRSLILEIVQILMGCLIAFGFIRALGGKRDLIGELNREILLMTILSSILGLLLPMDIFGIAPIILATCAVGLRLSSTIPMIASNFFFNMFVPFTDVGFNWKTGWLRVVIAFIMGISAGLLLSAIKVDNRLILRGDPENQTENPKNFLAFINKYMSRAGLFVIAGIILEVIFKEFFFYDLVNVINISSIAAVVFGFVKGYDTAAPVFIMNMIIFNLIINLKTLSGVIMLFKRKSVIGYYVYYCVWVLVFCIVNIFVS